MPPYVIVSTFLIAFICYAQGRDADAILFPNTLDAFRGSILGFLDDESSCDPPNGGRGTCVSLYSCQPLMNVINKQNKTPQDVDLLRKSACGFQGQTPKVCCPDDSCFTPDSQEGRCVNLYTCQHLADMLNPPVSQQTINFVQNSRCQGADQYSVCCGPPPSNNNQNPGQLGICTPSSAPPDPKTRCCGVDSESSDRIFGGTATSVDQYPWLVLIEYMKNNKIKLLCGGALISGRYVLTAGHCVVGPVLDAGTPRNIRLGEYDTTNDIRSADCVPSQGGGQDCTKGVTVIPIEQIIAHPEYNPKSNLRRHDIALIRMRQLAPYTDFIRPICLPTADFTTTIASDARLWAAGWGAVNETTSKSNSKQHVDLPFSPKDQCQPAYSVPRRSVTLWKGQVCAGGEAGKDSCKGDSGGPLMYEVGRHFEVVGIVSFGPTPCGIEDVPGVYTNVYEYNSWIRSQIKP